MTSDHARHPARRRWTDSAAIFVIGLIAVALVTAILAGPFYSQRADDRTAALAHKLEAALTQLDQARADAAAERRQASVERARLREQNRALHAQLATLIDYLQAHGLPVPDAILSSDSDRGRGSGDSTPKARAPSGASTPRPRNPGSPAGTPTPTPSPGDPGLIEPLCDLLHLDHCPLS